MLHKNVKNDNPETEFEFKASYYGNDKCVFCRQPAIGQCLSNRTNRMYYLCFDCAHNIPSLGHEKRS
jgi:hypothetical protein